MGPKTTKAYFKANGTFHIAFEGRTLLR